jgi:hypothetical protein
LNQLLLDLLNRNEVFDPDLELRIAAAAAISPVGRESTADAGQ